MIANLSENCSKIEITWMRYGEKLYGYHYEMINNTLTIMGTKISDSGDFTCHAK